MDAEKILEVADVTLPIGPEATEGECTFTQGPDEVGDEAEEIKFE